MPLPVVIIWGAVAAVTATGGYFGIRGVGKFSAAKKRIDSTARRHETWKARLEKERTKCERKVERFVLRAAAIRDSNFRDTTELRVHRMYTHRHEVRATG